MLSLNGAMTRTLQHLKNKIAREKERLEGIKNSYGFKRPDDIVHQYQQRLDEFTRLAGTNMSHTLALAVQRYRALHARLVSLGPESVLSRGYSICYRLDDKEVLLDSAALRVAAQVGVQFYKGRARVSVTEIEEEGTVSSLMRK
jgi:exodeoxyribonuclease VII large subunit